MTLNRLLSVIITTLSASVCWLVLPEGLELERKIPAFFAAVSMLCMALALWLSTRPKLSEYLFNGMDKAYKWHKWLGIFGLLGASLHWVLVPGPAGGDVIPIVAESGEEMGEVAMYLLLVLGFASVFKRLPYKIWHYSHKLMGPVFVISVYHTFFSDVPFETFSITGVVLIAISALGIGSWLYKISGLCAKTKNYHVSNIIQLDGAIELELEPVKKRHRIKSAPGQFAYLNFKLNGKNEFHPFTIASSGQQTLKFYIKALGDHTEALQNEIKTGQIVEIEGPYGRLHCQRKPNKAQIWLAGGIGITPFIAWLSALKKQRRSKRQAEIHIFFSANGKYFLQMCTRLNRLISPKQKIYLHTVDSSNPKSKRLDGGQIIEQINKPIGEYQVFACGPKAMLRSLRGELMRAGMSSDQWHNEHFDMR